MKRVFAFIVSVCMMLIIQACSNENKSIETMVSRSMKAYVKKHFDNPNDFKEVAYVELKSTLDQRPPVEEYLKERKEKDLIYNASADTLTKMIEEFKRSLINMNELSADEKEKVDLILLDYKKWEEKVYEYNNQADYRENCLNRVLSLLEDYYPIRIYEIGVRVKSQGNLMLDHYYTWACDTTTTVTIYNDAVPFDDLPLKKTLLNDYSKLEDCDRIRSDSYLLGTNIIERIRLFNH